MTVRIGINGFGRIGRSYLRAALSSSNEVEVVAINDIADAATHASLLEWDSLAGHLDGVQVDGNAILVDGARIRVTVQEAARHIGCVAPRRDLPGQPTVLEAFRAELQELCGAAALGRMRRPRA